MFGKGGISVLQKSVVYLKFVYAKVLACWVLNTDIEAYPSLECTRS